MFVTLALLACSDDQAPPVKGPTGDGLFLGGCPTPSRSGVRVLESAAETPWGADALAAPGDVLLFNEKAAFVLQSPDNPRTYYHYGGFPIDAVAVTGCDQAGPETLGEMGLVVGQLDLVSFERSGLHMIRGDVIEVVADGSDGGAVIVDVTGTDDRFWLIEMTLIRRTFEGGGRKVLDALYELAITLRYTLEPDEATLQLDVLLGGAPTTDGFLLGAVVFPSDGTATTAYASGDIGVGGLGLEIGIPWVAYGSDTGSTAVAMPGSAMARTEIAGVSALVDINQAFAPLYVAEGAATGKFVLSVGATDSASASAALEPYLPAPVPGFAAAWHDVAGTVVDGTGIGVPGANVTISTLDGTGEWHAVTTLSTGTDGSFAGRTIAVEGAWRVEASAPGRDSAEPVEVVAGTASTLTVGARGTLRVEVDDNGTAIPARIELERADGARTVAYPTPSDPDVDLAPGLYSAWISRGYEHAIVATTVEVPADGLVTLPVSLPALLDTTGWASFDSHVHTGPSPDSSVLPEARMRTAAGSGLDLVISTDHEAIVDVGYALESTGLADHLLYAVGSEVTASLPEHTNAWPFPAVPDHARGDPVQWCGLGFPGIYAAERARGATVVQLNHARVNNECGILCILDWDRQGDPVATDPEALGLAAGEEIWSWDFDSFEVLNGLRSPYLRESDPRHSGAIVDWFAFHNLGHPVTGTAVTDEHGMDTPGTPRTWVAVPDEFSVDDMAQAVLDGAAQFSAGAFARVSIDGVGPGGVVTVNGEATLAIEVQAIPEVDVTRVDVLVNCDLAESIEAAPDSVVKLDTTVQIPLAGDAYIIVIAVGENPMPRGLPDYAASEVPRVVVNPVFVDADGDGLWTPPGAKECDWMP